MLGPLRHISLENFKKLLELSLKNGKGVALSVREYTQHTIDDFDRGFTDVEIQRANWDAAKIREKLYQDIRTHAKSICSAKLSELKSVHEKRLYEALAIPMESLFDAGGHDIWLSIIKLYKRETENVLSSFLSSLSGFELDQVVLDSLVTELRNYARSVVENKARQEAGKVLIRMKDMFTTIFSHDKDSMPRVWTSKEDIKAITKKARASALKLLSALTVIRLDDEKDNIENILQSNLLEGKILKVRGVRDFTVPLSSSTWDGINPKNMLISPVQCKSIWRQFNAETEYIVAKAISAQEAYKCNNNWLPPPWAILFIAILGFNEFMMLLRNPFYIMVLFILYLLTKALWVQLDISGEFRHGPFSGLLALSAKFLQTVMNLLRKLADLGQIPHQPPTSNFQSFRSQSPMQNTIANSMSTSSSLSTPSFNNVEIESIGSRKKFTAADPDQESTT